MDFALRLTDIRKYFKGRCALDGLSLEVPKHAICAFVGANGAGKTTTFSIVGGYFKPDGGSIEVDGVSHRDFRRRGGIIGLLPQDVLFFEHRSVVRHLILFAHLSGFSGKAAIEEAERVLALVKLSERADDPVSELSHGMKMRLGIAQALVASPPIVLLDEPTAGLDPRMLANFREIVQSLRGTTTVVISSHDLSQLQSMCDYVCMIDQGKLVKQGLLSQLLVQSSRIVFRLDGASFESAGMHAELQKAFPEFAFSVPAAGTLVVEFEQNEFRVPEVNSRVLFWLFRNHIGVLGVDSHRSLEQTFLEETVPAAERN